MNWNLTNKMAKKGVSAAIAGYATAAFGVATTIFTIAFLVRFLSGCSSYPRREVFPDIKKNLIIVFANQAEIDRKCLLPGGKWDDGTLIMNGEKTDACFLPLENSIYLEKSLDTEAVCVVLHELGHASGRSLKDVLISFDCHG